MHTQFSTYAQRVLPSFYRGVEVFSRRVKTHHALDILTKSTTLTPTQKLPPVSLVPGMKLFQTLIAKSTFSHLHRPNYLIGGVLAATTLLTLSKRMDCDQNEEMVNLDKLSELVFESISALNMLKEKEAVLFIGATGSGKSTTLNYLMNIAMRIEKINSFGQVTLKTDDPDAFEIGDNHVQSKTTYVKTRQESIFNLWLTDCPGYWDSRPITYKFVSEISSYLATQTAKKVKAIVVTIGIDELKARKGGGLREIILTLHNFIKNGAEAKQSIFFLFTKSPITTNFFGGYYVQPAKKSEIIDLIKDIAEVIKSTPEKDLTDDDRATRSVIQLMIEGDDEYGESEERLVRKGPEGPRMFVIDIFNKEQRKEIIRAISDAPGLERDQFKPNIKGNIELSLRKSLSKHLMRGFEMGHLFGFLEKSVELEQKLVKSKSHIAQIEKDIENQNKGVPLDISAHLERMKEQTNQIERTREVTQDVIDHLKVQIKENDTAELVTYWKDKFFSEAPFFDFFPRNHTFNYKGQPFSQEVVEERGSLGVSGNVLILAGVVLQKLPDVVQEMLRHHDERLTPIIAKARGLVVGGMDIVSFIKKSFPVGEYHVIKNNKEKGEYLSRYSVLLWMATGDIQVVIEGPKNKREDVILVLQALRNDLDKAQNQLMDLTQEKRQKEEEIDLLKTATSNLEALKIQKSNLENAINNDERELLKLRELIAVLGKKIRDNKRNLENTMKLLQFDLIGNLFNPEMIAIFRKSLEKLNADPRFQKKEH